MTYLRKGLILFINSKEKENYNNRIKKKERGDLEKLPLHIIGYILSFLRNRIKEFENRPSKDGIRLHLTDMPIIRVLDGYDGNDSTKVYWPDKNICMYYRNIRSKLWGYFYTYCYICDKHFRSW